MNKENLKTLAGSEMVIVRNWHISTFTFLISFIVLYVFFVTFQPTTLLDTESFLIPNGTGGAYVPATSDNDKEQNNKLLTDHGRILAFSWAIGLGAAIGLLVHILLIYY